MQRAPRQRARPRIDGIRGAVVVPGDAGYDAARAVWNGQVDRRPAAIVRCVDVEDVTVALAYARANGLRVAVRGGGHHVAGHGTCDGGLVVDLGGMRAVSFDPATGCLRAQGGARLADVDRATVPLGQLVPMGIVTDTGIGGLTLGGGIGWTMRRFGLACDRLAAVEIVTADGVRTTIDERDDPELLWGLRGGGGNFAVVTEFRFRTQPFRSTVVAGFVVYPLTRGPTVLRALAEYATEAPRDVTTITFLRLAPPLPWMPAEIVGTPVVMIGVVHAGDAPNAIRDVAPLRRIGGAVVDTIEERPFLDHQAVIDAANPRGHRYYWKSAYTGDLSEDLCGTILDHAHDLSAPGSLIALFQMGRAVRDAWERSCFPFRQASFLVTYGSHWLDPAEDDRHRAWTRTAVTQIARHGIGGGYANFDADLTTADHAFPAETLRRLAALKRAYDPDNVFTHNINIRTAEEKRSARSVPALRDRVGGGDR